MTEQAPTPPFLRFLLVAFGTAGAAAGAFLGYGDGDMVNAGLFLLAGAVLGVVAAHVVNLLTDVAFRLVAIIGPIIVLLGILYVAYQRAM